jgi:cyclic pyranopterin phosphate synthase
MTRERAETTDKPGLPHLTATGAAHMIDVSAKDVTVREAVATGRLVVSDQVLAALRDGSLPKGDALAVARIAGIAGAKRVPDLLPLAHPVALHAVSVEVVPVEGAIDITARVRTADRTGIEMEALMAVAIAGLALHDMVKKLDPWASLTDVRLLEKSGGRSGTWLRNAE